MSKGLRISIVAFFDHNILIDVFIYRLLTVFAKHDFRHIEASILDTPSRSHLGALLGC